MKVLEEKLNEKDGGVYHTECRDCSVVSLAIAARVSYETAYFAMARAGRKRNRGAYTRLTIEAAKFLGCEVVETDPLDRYQPNGCQYTVKSIGKLCSDGYYLVTVKHHILAVVYGQVEDHYEGRKSRILRVLQIIKPNEENPMFAAITKTNDIKGVGLSRKDVIKSFGTGHEIVPVDENMTEGQLTVVYNFLTGKSVGRLRGKDHALDKIRAAFKTYRPQPQEKNVEEETTVRTQKGYKGHRAGSNKEKAHKYFDEHPSDADKDGYVAYVTSLGIQKVTALSWRYTFKKAV